MRLRAVIVAACLTASVACAQWHEDAWTSIWHSVEVYADLTNAINERIDAAHRTDVGAVTTIWHDVSFIGSIDTAIKELVQPPITDLPVYINHTVTPTNYNTYLVSNPANDLPIWTYTGLLYYAIGQTNFTNGDTNSIPIWHSVSDLQERRAAITNLQWSRKAWTFGNHSNPGETNYVVWATNNVGPGVWRTKTVSTPIASVTATQTLLVARMKAYTPSNAKTIATNSAIITRVAFLAHGNYDADNNLDGQAYVESGWAEIGTRNLTDKLSASVDFYIYPYQSKQDTTNRWMLAVANIIDGGAGGLVTSNRWTLTTPTSGLPPVTPTAGPYYWRTISKATSDVYVATERYGDTNVFAASWLADPYNCKWAEASMSWDGYQYNNSGKNPSLTWWTTAGVTNAAHRAVFKWGFAYK